MSLGSSRSPVAALREALAERGGTLAEMLAGDTGDTGDTGSPGSDAAPGPAQLAAAGPRASGHEAQYELLLEMIHEGSLLHYGQPRVVRPTDPDLALLLGDQLYALGLGRLAALGDLDAVGELGDAISLIAQAQADGNHELAEAVWSAGARAIGWGGSDQLQSAKVMARAGDPRATEALRAAALAGRGEDGGS